MPAAFATIDDFLASLPPDQREALAALRAQIRALVPDAEECFYYQLPAFRVDGHILVCFGAAKRHVALYPCSGRAVAHVSDALTDFSTSAGTIRFTPAHPLPPETVRQIVDFRLAENRTKGKRRA
jgi:uncharacterized protein YdhG (YjbR/CyaY superfamily)